MLLCHVNAMPHGHVCLCTLMYCVFQGRWLYALLVCLEKPLAPEACSLLRTLARNCANLRASLVSIQYYYMYITFTRNHPHQ